MGIFDFFLSDINVEIVEHRDREHLLSADKKTWKYKGFGEEIELDYGQIPHEFILLYKKYTFLGYYVFSEKLDDSALKGFVVQYEVKGSIKTDSSQEFEYKLQSLKKEQPKFYFGVVYSKKIEL